MSHPAARAALAALLCATQFCFSAVARAEEGNPPKPSEATAGMLEVMREKGIISEAEYEDLYRRQAMYELEQQQKEALPGWLKNWTIGGDATIRFDEINRGGQLHINRPIDAQNDPIDVVNGTGSAKNDRLRLRLRLGAEHTVGEDFLIGFRIATAQASSFGTDPLGGFDFSRKFNSDPRSAFVTMG